MAFRATTTALYRFFKGSTQLTSLPAQWQAGVDKGLQEIEKEVCPPLRERYGPVLITFVRILGSPKLRSSRILIADALNSLLTLRRGGPHKSTYEPEAGEDVVSVRLRTNRGTRIATAHIRQGGTYTKR